MPGFFARALREGHDVRHLQNHDPNLVLGRTKAGTTVLREDAKGLAFETRLGNRSYERDLAESVARGDVDEMSFGFIVSKGGERWVKDNGIEVRELLDGDLVDIATVTYPAYPGTSAGIDSRALFPHGAPAELRSRVVRCVMPAVRETSDSGARYRRALRSGRECGEARALSADGLLTLYVYDVIGEDWWTGGGITADWVRQRIADAGVFSRIALRINSVGGDMYEGIAIQNLLRAQGKPVEVFIDGVAASAASLIAMCGDRIVMGLGALMMVHCASLLECGDAAALRKAADFLAVCDAAGAEIYAARTGKSAAEIRALMEAETWMGSAEAKALGFCTEVAAEPVADEAMAAARSSRLVAMFRNVPAALAADDVCACGCAACEDGRCEDCEDAECTDPNCAGCPMQVETQACVQRRMRLRLAQVS